MPPSWERTWCPPTPKATYPQNPDTLLAGINLAITGVTNTSAGQAPTVTFTLAGRQRQQHSVVEPRHPAIHHGRPDDRLRLHQFRKRHRQHSRLRDGERPEGNLHSERHLHLHFHSCHSGRRHWNLHHRRGGAHDRDSVGRHNLLAERHGRRHESGGQLLGGRLAGAAAPHGGCSSATAINATSRFRCMAACATTPSIACCATIRRTRISPTRPNAVVASDKALPPQGINFGLLVHRIHDGVNVVADGGKPYIVVGFGGSHNDFSDVLFPAMSPTGSATYLQNCSHLPRQRQRAESADRPESGHRSARLDQSRCSPHRRLAADVTFRRARRRTS